MQSKPRHDVNNMYRFSFILARGTAGLNFQKFSPFVSLEEKTIEIRGSLKRKITTHLNMERQHSIYSITLPILK